jgi:hypothetical protein
LGDLKNDEHDQRGMGPGNDVENEDANEEEDVIELDIHEVQNYRVVSRINNKDFKQKQLKNN